MAFSKIRIRLDTVGAPPAGAQGRTSHGGDSGNYNGWVSNDAIKPEDRSLFREAMQDVQRLKDSERVERRKRTKPTARKSQEDDREVVKELLRGDWDPAELETGEELLYARSGIRQQTLRKLRRGKFSVRDELDLHQMNEEAARRSLDEFLRFHARRGTDCVKIIHGKGLRSKQRGPVLKRLVNGLLRRRSEVLAFASAKPADGGTGAVYVLLKRARPHPR